jgi:hypothetical protein
VGKIPEDRDARRAFLVAWAKEQHSRLAAEEQRPAAEEYRRQYVEALARVVAQARHRIEQVDSLRGAAVIPVVVTKPSDLAADRAAVFGDLMVGLREQKWADPIVSECDEPWYVAPKAVDLGRRHHPGAPWLLYMEDDVIIGPDFGLLPGLLREADELFPDTGVVSFYSGVFGEPGWSIHSMEQFGSLLCVAIRNTDHLAGFRAFIDYDVTQSPGKQSYKSPDLALQAFLATEYDAYPLWCPSLVQHADLTSILFGADPILGRRISSSYEHAYG